MSIKRLLPVFYLIVLSITISSQERYVKPVDEANLDPSFAAFRTKVVAAAERRDAQFILKILDPKIKLSFGGDAGIADFKRIWKINDKKSSFWTEFLIVVKNGGYFVREGGRRTNQFYAPYSFEGFPSDLDAFEYAAIFGSDVNLRERPSMTARVLERLSYNVVKIDSDATVMKLERDDVPEWFKIRTLGGKAGYVNAEFVRSPIDYRAGFEKTRGVWKLVTFIAGD